MPSDLTDLGHGPRVAPGKRARRRLPAGDLAPYGADVVRDTLIRFTTAVAVLMVRLRRARFRPASPAAVPGHSGPDVQSLHLHDRPARPLVKIGMQNSFPVPLANTACYRYLNIQRLNYLATIRQGFTDITGGRPRSVTVSAVAGARVPARCGRLCLTGPPLPSAEPADLRS
jgi:hypothetical protein